MLYIITFPLTLGLIGLGVSGFFLIRNEWVYQTRITFLEDKRNTYMKLPGYDVMMYRYWWVWSEETFIELVEKNEECKRLGVSRLWG